MKSDRFVAWLQVLGNFGLIAGLGLVAIQIQQNTDITRAQMISEDRSLAIALHLAMLGENPAETVAKSIDSPDRLTTEEMIVLDGLQSANYYYSSRREMLYRMGFDTDAYTRNFETPTNNALHVIQNYLGTPYGIAKWEHWNSEMGAGGPYANGAPLTKQAIEELLSAHSRPDAIVAERLQGTRARLADLRSNDG